jgi:hypothetical protein
MCPPSFRFPPFVTSANRDRFAKAAGSCRVGCIRYHSGGISCHCVCCQQLRACCRMSPGRRVLGRMSSSAAVPINHNGGETTFILQVTCSLGARVDIVRCVRVFACGYACASPPREQRTITVWMPSLSSTTTKRSPCASYSYTARATPASPRLLRTKSARAYNTVLRRMAVAPCRTRTQRVMASEPSHVRDSLQPLL